MAAATLLVVAAGLLERHVGATAGLAPEPVPVYEDRFVDAVSFDGFLKGNLHAHTEWSDGDAPPEDVVLWYRRQGYDFAAITDHNFRVDPAIFAHLERDDFILIPGEEVTMTIAGKPVHVNALCTERTIGELKAKSRVEALQLAIDSVNDQHGVALINHPNFGWSLGSEHLSPIAGAPLIEIASSHPHVHADGDDDHPSAEELWTEMLDSGVDVSPVAVDDAHYFSPRTMKGPIARPGGAWVGVLGVELERSAVCDALARGELFASTGPEIRRLVVDAGSLTVEVPGAGMRVDFLGSGGELLEAVHPGADGVARYTLGGGEKYVRARVTDTQGRRAFTRAFRVVTVEVEASVPSP